MSEHQSCSVTPQRVAAVEKLGMDEVHRTDVEGCWHPDLAAESYEALNKIKADLSMVQAAVDMRAGARQKLRGANSFRKTKQQPHGKGSRFAHLGTQQGSVF